MRNGDNDLRFQVLILCKTSQRRNLLQQGLNEVKAFESVRHLTVPDEIDVKLTELEALHLILISPEYNHRQVKSFTKAARKHDVTRETAFIMLLDFDDPNESEILRQAGVDDFLIPPYTVDTFNNLAVVTNKIIRKRSYTKWRLLMTDKLEAFINQLNLVALNKRTESKELLLNTDLLKQMGKALGPVPRDDAEMYIEVLMEVLTNPERQRKRIGYNGASNRVRRKFERLLEEEVSSTQLKGR